MKYLNLGPVSNADGSPTDLTKAMLEGTGRDPVAFARLRITVVYLPDGWSEPQELTVFAEDGESLDQLTDRAVNERWQDGDEPIDVRQPDGKSVWSNGRFGDLS